MHFFQTPKCGKISSKTSQPDFGVKKTVISAEPFERQDTNSRDDQIHETPQ